jgi:two-component system, NarL family, nitrate/nitrite response regulator NarL
MTEPAALSADPAMHILIVDDHSLLTETLSRVFLGEGDLLVDVAHDLDSAVAMVGAKGPYNVILLDYQMPGINGLEALRRLVELNGKGVALFSGVAGWSIVQRAIEEGASGFIPKTIPVRTLIHAVRFINDGEIYLPSEYMRRFNSSDPVGLGLKPREMLVLACLSEGLSNKEIGREVGIEEVIVKMDVKSVCRKLGVRNRTEAAITARRQGLC